MSYTWGSRSKERMQGVNPVLIQCATLALEASKHDMTIPAYGGYRSAEDQKELFDKVPKVTNMDGTIKKSFHQTGDALDVIPVSGGYGNDKAFRHFAACMFSVFQKMIAAGDHQGYTLEWGGNWQNLVDVPHWQIVKR